MSFVSVPRLPFLLPAVILIGCMGTEPTGAVPAEESDPINSEEGGALVDDNWCSTVPEGFYDCAGPGMESFQLTLVSNGEGENPTLTCPAGHSMTLEGACPTYSIHFVREDGQVFDMDVEFVSQDSFTFTFGSDSFTCNRTDDEETTCSCNDMHTDAEDEDDDGRAALLSGGRFCPTPEHTLQTGTANCLTFSEGSPLLGHWDSFYGETTVTFSGHSVFLTAPALGTVGVELVEDENGVRLTNDDIIVYSGDGQGSSTMTFSLARQ